MIKDTIENVKESTLGQGLVEYGLILALVSVVAVGALGGVGDRVTSSFNGVGNVDIGKKIDEGYIPVATAEDLDNIRNSGEHIFGSGTVWESVYDSKGLDDQYIQVLDIDLGKYDNWEPIGSTNESFKGVFDGGEYEIRNLTINKPDKDYLGLFGMVTDGVLKNIHINGAEVIGRSSIGSLLGGGSRTIIENSHTSTNIFTYGDHVGGLIGRVGKYSKVINSSSMGEVHSNKGYVGGLIGKFYTGTTVSRTLSSVDVSSDGSYVGGLVGHIWYDSILKDSYSNGTVTGVDWVGGLMGYPQTRSKIINSYSVGLVKGEGDYVGGVVGQLSHDSASINNFYDKQTSGQSDSGKGYGKLTSEMKRQSTYDDWDFYTVWQMSEGQYPTLR